MTTRRINLRASVDSANIRKETDNGREHYVVPSYTLPDNVVMNGGLYPADEIAKSFHTLEGTLAPFGHPVVNGVLADADHPQSINAYHIGAWNRNVKRVGNRVYMEKWIDIAVANASENGKRVIAAIEAGKPVHTSTGLLCNVEKLANRMKDAQTGAEWDWIARDMTFDHDAILLDEPGAATPEQGVGMLVNLQQTRVANALAAVPMASSTYGERMELLSQAVREKFGAGEDDYAYVEDFDDTHLIYRSKSGDNQISYTIEGGTVSFGNDPRPVRRQTRWVERQINQLCQLLGITVNSDSLKPETASGGKEMDKNEVEALISEAVKPLRDENAALATKVNTLEAANEALKTELTTVTNSQLADKRAAVKEAFGEKIANAAEGEMLDELFAQATAKGRKGVKVNHAEPTTSGAPDLDYLPEA